jgi:hypothetical protein
MKSITFSGMSDPKRGRTIIICSWFIIPKDELEDAELDASAVIAERDIPESIAKAARALVTCAVLENGLVIQWE